MYKLTVTVTNFNFNFQINELDPNLLGVGLGCLALGVIVRIFGTTLIAFGDKLNIKERVFLNIKR
jgi:hypothetical protein